MVPLSPSHIPLVSPQAEMPVLPHGAEPIRCQADLLLMAFALLVCKKAQVSLEASLPNSLPPYIRSRPLACYCAHPGCIAVLPPPREPFWPPRPFPLQPGPPPHPTPLHVLLVDRDE